MLESPRLNLSLDELCLFIDADGTLLDIAPRPDDVRASRDLLAILRCLHTALHGALAIVSGRRIEDLDRIFAPLRLPASGIHGAQSRPAPDGPIVEEAAPDLPAPVAEAVAAVAMRHPGVFLEDKGKALAVHWRGAAEAEAPLRAELDRIVDGRGGEIALMQGHCVFEIKSAATSKGEAVRAFMAAAPFAGRRPVFIGDDVTDIAGIAAAKSLGGLAFSVGQMLDGADGMFESPSHVRAWLAQLAGSHPEVRTA